MRYGYKASAEQFDPQRLLDYSRLADELGLHTVAISDHFQPWRHRGGHTPAVLPWLGAAGAGMIIRVLAGQGTAAAFIGVALAFLGLFVLGWRVVAGIVTTQLQATH